MGPGDILMVLGCVINWYRVLHEKRECSSRICVRRTAVFCSLEPSSKHEPSWTGSKNDWSSVDRRKFYNIAVVESSKASARLAIVKNTCSFGRNLAVANWHTDSAK